MLTRDLRSRISDPEDLFAIADNQIRDLGYSRTGALCVTRTYVLSECTSCSRGIRPH